MSVSVLHTVLLSAIPCINLELPYPIASANWVCHECPKHSCICCSILVNMTGATCTASSEHPGYECRKAFDGSLTPGTNEWSSYGDGDNAWILITFPHQLYITEVTLVQRCFYGDQSSIVRMEFGARSTGNLVSMHCMQYTIRTNGVTRNYNSYFNIF